MKNIEIHKAKFQYELLWFHLRMSIVILKKEQFFSLNYPRHWIT